MRGEKKYVITESQLIDLLIADMEYVMNERDGIDNWREYRESYSEVVKEFYPGDPAEAEKMTMRKCARARLEAGEFEEQIDVQELLENIFVDMDILSEQNSYN
jgi:hypothetical protein